MTDAARRAPATSIALKAEADSRITMNAACSSRTSTETTSRRSRIAGGSGPITIEPPGATDESVISPPAGGGILAQFHDQTASPLSGVAVAASGPDSDAATSDSNGCVIFSALPTGSYTLKFTDTGYVDPNGYTASPLNATASVASTGFAAPSTGNPVELGQGGGVTGSFYVQYPVGGTAYSAITLNGA